MTFTGIFGKEPHSTQRPGRPERTAQRPSHGQNMRFWSKPGRVRTEPLPQVDQGRPVARQVDGPGVAEVPRLHHPKRRVVVRGAALGNHDAGRVPVPDDQFFQVIRRVGQGLSYAPAHVVLLQFVPTNAGVLAFKPGQQTEIQFD